MWPERDHFDFLLLEEASKRELPILGICRGHQIINVARGGSLYQDWSYDKNCTVRHWQNQRPDLPIHTVHIDEDSVLHEIVGADRWVTNSHHHQAIHEVGCNLTVTGWTEDGTVEALEAIDYPYLVSY